MPDLRRLLLFLESAPAGTMVPVESLRELLVDRGTDTLSDATGGMRMLTPAEAADWLHDQLGGRKRTAAAVRKTMRTGFRGVVLKSYPYGRERRTTEADLRAFVARIGAIPRPAAPEQIAVAGLAPTAVGGFQVESTGDDPADEIAAAQERFRRRRLTPPRARPHQRRAAGGAMSIRKSP
jgi:hypothetical protein